MEPLWWAEIAEVAVTSAAAVLSVAVAVLLPMLRRWLASKTALGEVLRSEALANKMDSGVRNIIRAVEQRLLESIPRGAKLSRERVVAETVPMVEREFKETLEHFGKTTEGVSDYVSARVGADGVPPAVVRYRENVS